MRPKGVVQGGRAAHEAYHSADETTTPSEEDGWGSWLRALSRAGELDDDVHEAAGVPKAPTIVSALCHRAGSSVPMAPAWVGALFHLAIGPTMRKMTAPKSYFLMKRLPPCGALSYPVVFRPWLTNCTTEKTTTDLYLVGLEHKYIYASQPFVKRFYMGRPKPTSPYSLSRTFHQ